MTLAVIWAMTVSSIFVLRFKLPDHPRPYKCWGYPFVPALYIVVSLWMLYSAYHSEGIKGIAGIFVVLAAFRSIT